MVRTPEAMGRVAWGSGPPGETREQHLLGSQDGVAPQSLLFQSIRVDVMYLYD